MRWRSTRRSTLSSRVFRRSSPWLLCAAIFHLVGGRSGLETFDRGLHRAGADLTTVLSRHADVHSRHHAGLEHLKDVDSGRRATVTQIRDAEIGMFADRDVVKGEVALHHLLRRAT